MHTLPTRLHMHCCSARPKKTHYKDQLDGRARSGFLGLKVKNRAAAEDGFGCFGWTRAHLRLQLAARVRALLGAHDGCCCRLCSLVSCCSLYFPIGCTILFLRRCAGAGAQFIYSFGLPSLCFALAICFCSVFPFRERCAYESRYNCLNIADCFLIGS